MINLNPTLTAAGLALFSGQSPGFNVAITHIAFGSQKYDPSGYETALHTEVARYPIDGSALISPSTIQVGVLMTNTAPSGASPNNTWIGEIGFYAGSTLFAVLSHAQANLFYKSPDIDIPVTYVLDFSVLPPGSITVNNDALSSSIALASSYAQTAAATALNSLVVIRSSYYGSFAAAPTTRPDGTARQKGDRYFDSTADAEKTWNGSAWYIPNIGTSDLAGPGGAGMMGFSQTGVGSVAVTAQDKLREMPISGGDKGLSAAGTASANYTALSNAVAHIQNSGIPGKIMIRGGVYPVGGQLTINPLLVQIVGDGGVTLDFSSMVTGTGIKFQAVPTAGESITRNKMRTPLVGMTLKGASAMTLIDMAGTGGVDNSALTMQQMAFDTASVGISLGSNSWQLCLDGYGFTNVATHINELSDAVATNFGERNTFTNGLHSGTGCAFKSRNFSSDAHFTNVSFDCTQIADIARGARVFISDYHIEPGSDVSTLFIVDGDVSGLAQTSCSLKNGVLHLIGTDRVNDIFSCAPNYTVSNGGIDIDNLSIVYSGSFASLKSLVTGGGKVRARGLKCATSFPPMTIAASINETSSPGFEVANLAASDWVAIDAGSPPTIDATTSHSGTSSLKMVQAGTAQVGASLTKPVRPGQNAFLGLWYKLTSVATGGAAYKAFNIFAKAYDSKGNVLGTVNEEVYLTGTTGWTYYTSSVLRRTPMPTGASTLVISVMLYSAAGGSAAWVGDVVLNIID